MNADTIGVVAEGQEITVAGSPAWAMRVTVDPTAGICAIEYLLQKPK
jgi:hypothetical protein